MNKNSPLMLLYKMKLIIFKIILFLIVESVWSKYSDKFKTLCGQPNLNQRIIRGSVAFPGEFPFIARLLINDEQPPTFLCDGSLITDRHVLTASHCFEYHLNSTFIVSLGDHNVAPKKRSKYAVFFGVLTIRSKGNLRRNPEEQDVAIIKLAQKVKFTRWISPICLPYNFSPDSLFGKDATVIGYGIVSQIPYKSAVILQKVDITVRRIEDCSHFAKPPGQICAGNMGKGACFGDSGGPLFKLLKQEEGLRYTQVGIVSYGPDQNCGKLTIYADVNFYLKWIENILNE